MNARLWLTRSPKRCSSTGKHCHASYFAAQKYLRRAQMVHSETNDRLMRIYRCRHCQAWHFGHDWSNTRMESWKGEAL
jgi:hypothetical protein